MQTAQGQAAKASLDSTRVVDTDLFHLKVSILRAKMDFHFNVIECLLTELKNTCKPKEPK